MNPLDAIDVGKLVIRRKMPWFTDVLFRMRPCAAPGHGTIAIDAGLRLFYDPEVVARWIEQGPANMVRPLFHEIDHWLRHHFERRLDREAVRWNRACDREINGDQEAIATRHGWQWPEGFKPLMPEQLGMSRGLTAEEYYGSEPPHGGETSLANGACGGCTGNPTARELENAPDHPEPLTEGECEIIREQVAHKIMKAHRGDIPSGLAKWAEERLAPPRVDYRRLVAKMVRSMINSISGAFDYTRARPGRRYLAYRAAQGSSATIPPAMVRPTARVTVIRDTSGSMGFGPGSPLGIASSEILGIARASGAEITMIDVDADAAAPRRVQRARDLAKVVGGGGTDMRVGIREAAKGRPDMIFLVTDGETPWPEPHEVSRCLVAVIIGSATPPPYIRFVKVPVEIVST